MKIHLLLFLLFFPAVPLVSQNDQAVTMHGIVTGDGKPIQGAFVLLRDCDSVGQDFVSKNWQIQTEAHGRFSLVVKPGCYDLFVSSGSFFLPFSKRIHFGSKESALKVGVLSDRNARLRIVDQF